MLHTAAWAAGVERKPPTARASLTAGVAVRSGTYDDTNSVRLTYSGLAPTVVSFDGALFFLPWLGAALDLSLESFAVLGKDLIGTEVRQQLFGFRILPEAVGRWSPLYWLGLELHVGYGGGQLPNIALVSDGQLSSSPVKFHGPSAALYVALEPDLPVGGHLFARILPTVGGGDLRPLIASFGLQVHGGNLAVGNLRGAIALDTELLLAGADRADLGLSFAHTELRFSLGLRLRHQPEVPPELRNGSGPSSGTGTVKGRVVSGGAGLSGASVTVGTLAAVVTGPEGTFELEDVQSGSYPVRAVAEGYKPVEQQVTVTAGGTAEVTLSTVRPTGPGRIRGVVKGEKDLVVEGAEVAAEGGKPVKTGSDGSFTLEGAGPGPVKVKVSAKGYQNAEDAAQVPPEGVATLDFSLVKQGERVLATVRGSVKSASGKGVRATVKVSELNLTVPVKGDGRFVVQVPGGKYTLTIEAAGYVTQVKTLEVADGDQAIFHCDLQPVGR